MRLVTSPWVAWALTDPWMYAIQRVFGQREYMRHYNELWVRYHMTGEWK